ncbi:hypothetical protein V6N12_044679 [Hibiscus sabdariffa]|uniref:Uncharacterized protein n=1 Tax=Hibiscus sabdariffa TaxID=183260 RepID=A0ABR2ARX9_9ROSI
MDLKSCSAAFADEWTAPTVKHRRSSSEFGLAKGDGWLKEFEGWRFKINNGGYYAVGSGYWVPESLVACHDLLLLDDLIIWFCMSLLPLSFCYDSKVGEVDVGAFSSMVKDWGGLVLPVGHAPLASTVVCGIGDTNLFLMGGFA